MKKFAFASLFFAVLLFLFGCSKREEKFTRSPQTTTTEKPVAPAQQTVTLAVEGIT